MPGRVVITSMGAVTPLGSGPEEIINNLRNGGVSFIRVQHAGGTIVSPVRQFDLKEFTGRFKYARYLSRGSELGLAAALLAVRDSDIGENDIEEAGLFTGTGPNLDIGADFPETKNGFLDSDRLSALWILKYLPNTLGSVIAQITGIRGENLTIGTACAASLQAIGEAFRRIRDGYLDLALAGGGDSRINPGGILSYKKAHALYSGDFEPENASRPFDGMRSGFVSGEGGAFFILEELSRAKKRKAPILAEVCGYGSSIDGHSMTAPQPDGLNAEKAINSALNEAGITPGQIDVISTHGTSTPLNDSIEAEIIERIFSGCRPDVIALKSWIGHGAAACGALELAICLVCMKNNYIPEIRNLEEPCNNSVNFARTAKTSKFKSLLIQNFGFGGQNSALVLKSYIKQAHSGMLGNKK